ncbi:recombinase family protein [Paenibacillus sp. FSL H8-0034]|uniref:recombinase family protein n=1 Tax=Paenibacillus sp. FSL H8-0034 TaxID=2954671 RepID=UPI0030FC1944
MNVVTYLRVSSEQQAHRELSIPAQREALIKHAMDKGWTIVEEYLDEAKSAKNADRPDFQRMVAAAQQPNKNFKAILVHKFDRFSRSREDHIVFKALLKKQGVSVLSVSEPTEPDTPHGLLLEGMLEVISEFYNMNLKHETMKGMKENAIQGWHCGGRPPYGYRLHKVGSRVSYVLGPDEEVQTVKLIFQAAAEGAGGKKIPRMLNELEASRGSGRRWSPSTVLSLLSNHAYLGYRTWNRKSEVNGCKNDPKEWIVTKDCHPAIIDENLWNQAQIHLNNRRQQV